MNLDIDLALKTFAEISWSDIETVPEMRQAAINLMATWDWQQKVPKYTNIVNKMTSRADIYWFMRNSTARGAKFKIDSVMSSTYSDSLRR